MHLVFIVQFKNDLPDQRRPITFVCIHIWLSSILIHKRLITSILIMRCYANQVVTGHIQCFELLYLPYKESRCLKWYISRSSSDGAWPLMVIMICKNKEIHSLTTAKNTSVTETAVAVAATKALSYFFFVWQMRLFIHWIWKIARDFVLWCVGRIRVKVTLRQIEIVQKPIASLLISMDN